MKLTWTNVALLGILALGFVLRLGAQQNTPPTSAQNEAPASARPDSAQVIQLLSRTIAWRRQVALESKLAINPVELKFAQEDQRLADQVVRLAFEYARNQAKLLAKPASVQSSQTQPSDASGQYQRLAQ